MRRRHPGQTAYNALAKRQLYAAISAAAETHACGRLLDIGCGLKPYQQLFAPLVTDHVGVDHPESLHASTHVDVRAGAYDIPLDDGTFDTVLMSELIEHLERPVDALAEAHRLLRSGGKIIVSTPFIWPVHEAPRDFFRYSPFGLRYVLEQAGFAHVIVTPISGQWATLSTLFAYGLRRSPAVRLRFLLRVYLFVQHRIAVRMDRSMPRDWMSWNHVAVATKQ